MDTVALTNLLPKIPRLSAPRHGGELSHGAGRWFGYQPCRVTAEDSGRNPFTGPKQTPTLIIMIIIIINYKDRAELPQPEPLPRKTSFSLDEKSLGCLH